ncbi:MAG TPA: 3-oxoadipyl-CoA thiolase [Micromonospora sp.]|nr:3-oxoadipyl-CoA thiolase [Micromonospora sp.]
MTTAFLVAGVRTPIGRYGGALAGVRPDDLAAHVIRELVDRHPSVDWAAVDDVVLGCANQAGEDNRNVARMAALLGGLPEEVSGTTVNRLCGSGLDAVAIAARSIVAGEADLVVAGGVESMTRAPFVMPKAPTAYSRAAEIYDTTIGWRLVNPLMDRGWGTDSMPETGENVAADYGIDRAAQDRFALRSQERASRAQADGRLAEEIVSITVPEGRRGTRLVSVDEHPRQTSLEKLAALPTPFRSGGTVTAGNSSGVNDGAVALLVVSEAALARYGLTPLARIVGAASAGVAPRTMGMGPVPATRRLLARQGLTLAQIDVVELNEAFAAQAVAVLREWGLPEDAEHVNPNGGAIALGHPLGASGARLALTAALQLRQLDTRRALCTMCVGVGQGISVLLEAPA